MKRSMAFAIILVMAFAFRGASFGNPTIHTDEEFYFLIGQAMLDGQLPYVDIWDRKPLGLFLIYAAIAAVSRAVVAYQIAATLFAAATAYVVTRIVADQVRWPGQLVAAFLYLALLPGLGGMGGQTPVFYNLPVALAALLVVRSLPDLEAGQVPGKVLAAMALCGAALTIKQTAVVEAAYLGMVSLILAWRGGMPLQATLRCGLLFAVIGIAPSALIAGYYWAIGHWAEFYQATITSNLDKGLPPVPLRVAHGTMIAWHLWLPILIAGAGLLAMKSTSLRLLLAGWLVAAMAALLLVPNFYWHYALPILPTLCCCVATACERSRVLALLTVATGAFLLIRTDSFDLSRHREARANATALARAITLHSPRRTLFVYDGPVYLYPMTRIRPLSPVVLPWHFVEAIEDGATGRDTNHEIARILGNRPSAVTVQEIVQWAGRDNVTGRRLVRTYVAKNCSPIVCVPILESRTRRSVTLYGDCR